MAEQGDDTKPAKKKLLPRVVKGAIWTGVLGYASVATLTAGQDVFAPLLERAKAPTALKVFQQAVQAFETGLGFVDWLANLPSNGLYQSAGYTADNRVVGLLSGAKFMNTTPVGSLVCSPDYSGVYRGKAVGFSDVELTEYTKTGLTRTYHLDNTLAKVPQVTVQTKLPGDNGKTVMAIPLGNGQALNFARRAQLACERTNLAARGTFDQGGGIDGILPLVSSGDGYFLQDVFQTEGAVRRIGNVTAIDPLTLSQDLSFATRQAYTASR